ncbi:hypothetical protein [Niveibacterium sp.]|uniref:hypothetical protein n=1 Tax=Niveibacterium sp. TaxID=2017444 RepID=UPI0035AFD40C
MNPIWPILVGMSFAALLPLAIATALRRLSSSPGTTRRGIFRWAANPFAIGSVAFGGAMAAALLSASSWEIPSACTEFQGDARLIQVKKNFGGGTLELKTSTGISRQSLNCTAVTDFCKWLRGKSETGRSVEYVPVHICLRHNSESEAAQLSWSRPPSIALSAEEVARRGRLLRASDRTTFLVIACIAISLATSTLAWFIVDEARKGRAK